ncbi:MAG: peptidase M16 [Bacteroidales bacterium]|nr:MAG: peptidase M16 [Bacteroidales bacterium]
MQKKALVGFVLMIFSMNLMAQTSSYKLKNGLTVILNEDHLQSSVFGCVVVKSGSKDDPADATGLAHYLEHVMFKGTTELGTTNWEAEKVHYNKIISLYDDLASTSAEEAKQIQKEINKESIEAGKYTIANEFSNIVQSMGGTSLNASTGYDMTQYFNIFPSGQMQAWLELYSHRFINPVFRGFQAELETVYEEKNMYSDSPFSVLFEQFNQAYYGEKHPYGRPILGFSEHLKTPCLSKLIDQYYKYYVPKNMALILSGDFNSEDVKGLISETFGKWESKPVPEKTPMVMSEIKGKKKVKLKLTPFPVALWGFPAVPTNHEDETAIEIACMLLSNSNQTGILDKYVIEGDIQSVSVNLSAKTEDGLIQFIAVPTFDFNQLIYTSLSSNEKLIFKGIDKLNAGDFEDWVLEAIKDNMCREYDLAIESNISTGRILTSVFAGNQTLEDFNNYKTDVKSITKERIIEVANKYFGDNYLAVFSDLGKPKKDKLTKPELDPIEPAHGEISNFFDKINQIGFTADEVKYLDFTKDVRREKLGDKVNMFYAKNPKNEIFTLTLKYGAGSNEIPTIGLATNLMNKAGIMAEFTPHELKKEFSKISCSCNFYNSESYTYVQLQGKEENLAQACKLLSKTYILPALDDKQMNSLLGSMVGSRRIEKNNKESQAEALQEFLYYGKNSPSLTRLTKVELLELTQSSLAADFIKATQYETSVHYTGQKSFDEVREILTNNLAFPSGLSDSKSPYIRPVKVHNENIIYFLNNKDARQSDVFLMLNGTNYNLEERPYIDAFNQYFSGGFNGIVLQELRELRSFAYTAYANYSTPALSDNPSYLGGFIGVQADKTSDALEEFVKLLKDLPQKPERMDNLKKYLKQASASNRPSFRRLSQVIESWEKIGFTEDPIKQSILCYNDMSFEDIMTFYKSHIQNKPIAIAIVGNKKLIDMKKLEKFGKIKYISSGKLFKN